MKKSVAIIIFFISIALMTSCSTNSSLNNIKTRLASRDTFRKKDTASTRTFEPYLDGKWIGNAASYGCYRQGQAPGIKGPTEEEILEDLTIISTYWTLVRIYNADDDAEKILRVINRNNLPIKIMLGVWLENETQDPSHKEHNISNTLRAIELANSYPDIIVAVNAGNETQVFWSWHKMNTEDLIHYIRAIRNNISQPVTTADDYNFWNKPESKHVAEEIDFIVTHIYPLWNGKTLKNAIPWLDTTYQAVQSMHPDKQIVLGEIGWATKYNAAKKGDGEQGSLIKGEVSIMAQEKFLIELSKWIEKNQITTFLFEIFDEPWKGGGDTTGPNEVEKNWGVFYEDRKPKTSFENFIMYKDNPERDIEFNNQEK